MSISVTKLFGLEDERWTRHANPVSVWTRFAGLGILVYGLVGLNLLAVVSGLLVTQTAKAWFIDRMVLLYDMKARDPAYAGWER